MRGLLALFVLETFASALAASATEEDVHKVEVPVSRTGSVTTTAPSVKLTSCPADGGVFVTDALFLSVEFGGGFQLGGDHSRSVCFTVNGFARQCHSSYPPQWLCPELFATPAALPDPSDKVHVSVEIVEGDGDVLGSTNCSFIARRWGVKAKGEDGETKETVRGRRPIVIDAVMVFDEVDMLELRMHELAPLDDDGNVLEDPSADLFLVVESEITHSGKRKEMYFGDVLSEPSSRFLPWKERILHVVLHDMDFPAELREGEGVYSSQHSREIFQRNQLVRALGPGGMADLAASKIGLRKLSEGLDASLDIVVFGDADEIPSPAALRSLRSAGW